MSGFGPTGPVVPAGYARRYVYSKKVQVKRVNTDHLENKAFIDKEMNKFEDMEKKQAIIQEETNNVKN